MNQDCKNGITMNLTNATALITGGSSGIGYAIAKSLAESGAKVAITGRHRSRLTDAEQALGVYEIGRAHV